jgi:hypothetical protein
MDFETKDSGKREEFSTGSLRDTREGKGRFDLIPTKALKRLAQLYERGATKYGDHNWTKGQPITRYIDSAMRHLTQVLEGHTDEDHAIAVAWNAFVIVETLEMIEAGKLPPGLDDRLKLYTGKKTSTTNMNRKDAFNYADKLITVLTEVCPECYRETNPVLLETASISLCERYLQKNDLDVDKTIEEMRETFWAKDFNGNPVPKDFVEHFGENVI